MAKDCINILSVVYSYGVLHMIFNQPEPHNPIRIFFHSKCFMQLIPCDFESGGHIFKAQNIINMDCKDGNIATTAVSE